jgi:hypothetical protein
MTTRRGGNGTYKSCYGQYGRGQCETIVRKERMEGWRGCFLRRNVAFVAGTVGEEEGAVVHYLLLSPLDRRMDGLVTGLLSVEPTT